VTAADLVGTAPTTAPLAAALAAFQAEMPTVAKSHEADTGTYRYKYADLADVTNAAMPLLTAHGLSFATCPRYTEHGYELVGVLLHSSGESMEGALPIGGNTPQALGSSLTYARRYLFGCMTGVVTDDDDDGRIAAAAPKAPRKRAAAADRPAGAVTPKQIRAIGALMSELKLTDRNEALDYVSNVVGRGIASRNDLTEAEASKVIDALHTQGAPGPSRRTVEAGPTPVDPWGGPVANPPKPPPPPQGSAGPPGPADPEADYRAATRREVEPGTPVAPSTRVDPDDVPLPFDDIPPGSDTKAPTAPPTANRVPAGTARRIERLLKRELGDIATEADMQAMMAAILGLPVASVEALTLPQAMLVGEAVNRFADGSAKWEFDLTVPGPGPVIRITQP
jgi:hypothetical protein